MSIKLSPPLVIDIPRSVPSSKSCEAISAHEMLTLDGDICLVVVASNTTVTVSSEVPTVSANELRLLSYTYS